MKNIITLSLIAITFFACSKGGDKKSQLDALKKEQAGRSSAAPDTHPGFSAPGRTGIQTQAGRINSTDHG